MLVLGLGLSLALTAGCSDDSVEKDGGTDGTTNPDIGNQPDSQQPDTLKPDVLGPSNVGEKCSQPTDCKSGSPLCITYTKLFGLDTGKGICSMFCTPDDRNTPLVDEDNCPTGSKCAYLGNASTPPSPCKDCYCLKECTPSITTNPCPKGAGTTCHPTSARWHPSGKALCIWPACETDKDCPVQGSTTCTGDSECTSLGTGAYCYFATSTAATGTCALPGKCTASGLCGVHTHGKSGSKVGDACTSDLDCPNNGQCFEETTGSQYIGKHWANGYCVVAWCKHASTMSDFACPTGSGCHGLYFGGICMKTCNLDSKTDCRNNSKDKGGDYECYAWNNLTLTSTGAKVSQTPLCESAAQWNCAALGTTKCTSLGLASSNKTNMNCRDRTTGVKKSNIQDPTGVCLDDTASGPFQTATDAGAADAGTD
jgi:hypothetical protein